MEAVEVRPDDGHRGVAASVYVRCLVLVLGQTEGVKDSSFDMKGKSSHFMNQTAMKQGQ